MTVSTAKNLIALALASFTGLAVQSCGPKSSTTSAQIASTDQRPDISDDRTSVHITAGTRDFIRIHAKDLSGLVTHVPNPETGEISTQRLTGSYIFQVAQNPRTNLVAIGVRSFIYAEVDFSMVFLINPAFPNKPQLLSYDAPGQKRLPNGTTKPLRAIRSMSFDSSGVLHIVHSDASGSKAKVLVNPDMSIRSCEYIAKEEGSLCNEGH
ncbi:MAG: hypothetical protein RL189_656 [Pseudomonadota bacterium]|jgi:hypothetical protein